MNFYPSNTVCLNQSQKLKMTILFNNSKKQEIDLNPNDWIGIHGCTADVTTSKIIKSNNDESEPGQAKTYRT